MYRKNSATVYQDDIILYKHLV